MHEMGITRNIVAIVTDHAGDKKVRRVRLEVGKLSSVMPQALLFCFDVVAKGTPLEGAELEIIEIAGKAQCSDCKAVMELKSLVGVCSCGSHNLVHLSGEELNIKEMELEAA